uniref:coiled-coil domain-containing protein 183 n=1 Tax=Myxine glutinosa TaxID=7769 RepID=UPI00358FCE0B
MLRKSIQKSIKTISLEISVADQNRKVSLDTARREIDENNKKIRRLQEENKQTSKLIHKVPQYGKVLNDLKIGDKKERLLLSTLSTTAIVEVVKEWAFRQSCQANLAVAERRRKEKQLKALTAKVEHMNTLKMVSTTQAKAQQEVRMLENMLEKIKMKVMAARNIATLHSKLRNSLLQEYKSSMKKLAELEEIVNLQEKDLENARSMEEEAARAEQESKEKEVSAERKQTKEARKQTWKLSIKDKQLTAVKEKQEEAMEKLIANERVNQSTSPAGTRLNKHPTYSREMTPSLGHTYQQDVETIDRLLVKLKETKAHFETNSEKLPYLKSIHSELTFHEPLHKASLAKREAELQERLTHLQSRQTDALAAFVRESRVHAGLLHSISALYSKLGGIIITTSFCFDDAEDKGSKGSDADSLEHRSLGKSPKCKHDAHTGSMDQVDIGETLISKDLEPLDMLQFCEDRLLQLSAVTGDTSVHLDDPAVKEKIQNLLEQKVQEEWQNCRINMEQQQQSEETMFPDEDNEDDGSGAPTNADIKKWGQRLIAKSLKKQRNKRANTL